ncbi:PaaI family thioesterase [Bacterioplanes sanyensis]|uniref:PaaI family thioesterase n=1 Tax=Bacterioplanes sanyensis TaxID=1249553 RepID=UPI001E288BF2|nr:PaaI family thioesterase [Bacterioplanes sanyensis]
MKPSKQQLQEFFTRDFPQANFSIDDVGERSATVRKKIAFEHLRPGGTVSGPVMMEVADTALYVAILHEIGLVALAVTTNLNINFLNKPVADKDLVARCQLIKVGKTLIIGDVFIYSDGQDAPVAHAVGTYSIPPKRNDHLGSVNTI